MAWTARWVERGEAVAMPDPPEVFSDGVASAIWYCDATAPRALNPRTLPPGVGRSDVPGASPPTLGAPSGARHSRAHPGASIDAAFDAVADALHSMTLTPDADLAANAGTHVLTFCLAFPGAVEPESALGASLTIAREAIGSAGLDATAWEVVRASVEPTGHHAPLLQTA